MVICVIIFLAVIIMAMRRYVNYYEELGIGYKASYREIKDAYLGKVLEFNDKVNGENIDLSDYEKISDISRGFFYFSDMEKRFMYDLSVMETNVSIANDKWNLYDDLYVLANDYSLDEDKKLLDVLMNINRGFFNKISSTNNKDLLNVYSLISINCKIIKGQLEEKEINSKKR